MTHDNPYDQREADGQTEDMRQRRADEADEAFNERRQLDDDDDDEIRIGDIVETAVYVCGERRPMGRGRVEAVHSGYCDVDHCYPYARPWIYGEATCSLRKIRTPPDDLTNNETRGE